MVYDERMAQRRHHYEQAFEHYLRLRRIPYVAVNEAKKALLPDGAALRLTEPDGASSSLKSFDFVIYGDGENLLVEAKGRKIARRRSGVGRLESWVTEDDVEALSHWEDLFGAGFAAAFVFVYWCESAPPMALFEEVFDLRGRFYALRAVRLADYVSRMKHRSRRWRTVDLPTEAFDDVARPLVAGAV